MKTRIGLKEWAGVIEALADGRQILLVRKYPPEHNEFLLYPTYSYYSANKNYPDKFKRKFRKEFESLAREAAEEQLKNSDIVEIKYWFAVDKVYAAITQKQIRNLGELMIWSVDHVADYAETAKHGVCVWTGRTFKLPKTVLAARQTGGGSIMFYKHYEDVLLQDSKSTITEDRYLEESKKVGQVLG